MKIVKTSLAVLLLTLAMAGAAYAQTDTDTQKCFAITGTTDYYFGEIDQSETVEHTFEFKNSCSETIEISQARASCGCTAAVLSEKVIPPGGTAKIQVKFTPPKGSRGKVTKTVSVYLKDDDKPHTVIRFSAKIKTDLDIQPPYVQLLGAEVGKEISGTATVKNVSDGPLTIEEISVSMTTYADTSNTGRTVAMPLNGVKVTPSKVVLKPGESKDITVTLLPIYKGQVNGAVRLKTDKNEGILQVFGVVREAQGSPLRSTGSHGQTMDLDSK